MKRTGHGFGQIWLEVLLIPATLLFVFPMYILFAMSLKTGPEIAASPVALPGSLDLANFMQAWTEAELGRALWNSSVVTVISVVGLVLLGSAAAYSVVRSGRRLDAWIFLVILLGMMIPLQLGMVPLYTLMRDLGLLQSYTSVILFNVGTMFPLTVFLYAGFLRALPPTYEEAAQIDGASSMQIFTLVVFPLVRPVTGTIVIINGINIWNDFLTPLLYLGGSDNQTVPVAIFSFLGEYATSWGMIFAGMVIAIVPILFIYFLLQRYIIQGFASGLKG